MARSVYLFGGIMLGLLTASARAERPAEERGDAKLVVVGTIKKIAMKNESLGRGAMTHFTADVSVSDVEKGKLALDEVLKVYWFGFTKPPTELIIGAGGFNHKIKEGDKVRFWLSRKAEGRWEIIYNRNGVQVLKE